jgi:4'-phosphopantetheinyl transferase EntD
MQTTRSAVEAALGVRVAMATATEPIAVSALTRGEREQLARLPSAPARRREWLMARGALRAVLAEVGSEPDTATIRFPSPTCSVTHGGGLAMAIAAHSGGTSGIGLDFEPHRSMNPTAAKFFLTAAERAWVDAQPASARSGHLLRLWTVKEAAYKANTCNRGTHLRQYTATNAARWSGVAFGPSSGAARYVTIALPSGVLTVAARARDEASAC